jgi:hypothetical protein
MIKFIFSRWFFWIWKLVRGCGHSRTADKRILRFERRRRRLKLISELTFLWADIGGHNFGFITECGERITRKKELKKSVMNGFGDFYKAICIVIYSAARRDHSGKFIHERNLSIRKTRQAISSPIKPMARFAFAGCPVT